MSSQTPSTSYEILPAVMLAALIAVTGLEMALVVAAPHKAVAHPVRAVAQLDDGHAGF